jgi:2-methylisocitrate lyase-like PEP mutase family enzyme
MSLTAKAARFRALHTAGAPLVLPNAWDAASARLVVGAGFDAVATTSAGIANSLGYEDREQTPPDEMFAAIARIARAVDAPVTADIESGYGLPADELVERLLAAGVVGCNIEDTDHARGRALADAAAHAARLAAVKQTARARGIDLFLNARTDAFLLGAGNPEQQLAESLRRARLYREAGADCVYPILVAEERAIRLLVEGIAAPVNVLLWPKGPPLPRLRALGAARISLGPFWHRSVMETAGAKLAELRAATD